ncbi:hypothetical protein NECAME_12977 [Necator americanus]|uniref:Uncharacterized protein n=1 Tax=Necator americanus TaxID=51031 RepID=W2T0G4_NECAM|nr:hypothetical protein NECAME_12977 [Necator americanus]ETN74457.1 hypothetical protein NECAME_12977 [Necator americanus]
MIQVGYVKLPKSYSDYTVSLQSREHFLGAETSNLLRMRCHADFYKKLESCVNNDVSEARNVCMLEDASFVSPPPTVLQAHEVSVDENLALIRVSGHAEIFLPVSPKNFARLTVVSQLSRKQNIKKTWARVSCEREGITATRNVQRDARVRTNVLDESSIAAPTMYDLVTQRLKSYANISCETEPDITTTTEPSTQKRTKTMKRKMSAEFASGIEVPSLTKKLPYDVSKFAGKSAKLEAAKYISRDSDTSFEESFSYTLEGERIFKPCSLSPHVAQNCSSHQSFLPSDRGEEHSRMGTTMVGKSSNVTSFEEDTSVAESSVAELRKQFRTRSAEGLHGMSRKELSSLKPKSLKNEDLSPSKLRGRRSDASASIHHRASGLSAAQAIIEAWRASSFEVLPENSSLPLTQRDPSVSKSAFSDLPTISDIRKSKNTPEPFSSPYKQHDSVEVDPGDRLVENISQSGRQQNTILSPGCTRERTIISGDTHSTQEEIRKRTLRSYSSVQSFEVDPSVHVSTESSQKTVHRSQSPQKRNTQKSESTADIGEQDFQTNAGTRARFDENVSHSSTQRVVTFESSPVSSQDRMVLRSGSEHSQRRSSARRSRTPSQRPSTPSQRSKTPTQQPKTPTLRPRTPTQHLETAQRPKTPTQRSKTPTQHLNVTTQRPKTPAQRPKTPTHHLDGTSQRPKTPTQRPKTPTQYLDATSQRPKTPTQRSKTPTHHQDSMAQRPKIQMQRPKTPTKHLESATQRPKTPVQRSKAPVQRSKTTAYGMKIREAKPYDASSSLEVDLSEQKPRRTRNSRAVTKHAISMSSGEDSASNLLHKDTRIKTHSKSKGEESFDVERPLTTSSRLTGRRGGTSELLRSSSPEKADDESSARRNKKTKKVRTKVSEDSKFTFALRSSSQSSLEDNFSKIKRPRGRVRKEIKARATETTPPKRVTRSKAEHSTSEGESRESANERKSSLRRKE